MITQRAHGIDISKYDLTFDPSKAVEQLDFVVQRTSYGIVRDEAFDTLYAGVQKMPIRLGYHYLNSGVSVTSQVDKFLSIVDGKGYHAFACDFEEYFNTMSVDFARMAWDFIRNVTIATGKRVMLYTNPDKYFNFIQPAGVKYALNWNLVDLWVAQWFDVVNPDGQPNLSKTNRTSGWNLWQYQNNKTAGFTFGIGRTTVDLNVFNGTVAEMRTWLGITEPVPTPSVNPRVTVSFTDNQGKTFEAKDVEMTPKP